MPSQRQFFALDGDLRRVLSEIESAESVEYVLADRFLAKKFPRYGTFAKIPDLSKADSESASTCKQFLVVPAGSTIRFERVHQYDGVDSFHIHQMYNSDSVVFAPGGIWKETTLLYGSVGSVSDSDFSKKLMKRFRSSLQKNFQRIDGWYYLGPEALSFLKAGHRLTIAAQSPPEFDLVLR